MELLIEWFEDNFEEHPQAMATMATMGAEEGEALWQIGDPLIDKWERELAMGLTPDFAEGMDEKGKKYMERDKQKAAARAVAKEHGFNRGGFVDRYGPAEAVLGVGGSQAKIPRLPNESEQSYARRVAMMQPRRPQFLGER